MRHFAGPGRDVLYRAPGAQEGDGGEADGQEGGDEEGGVGEEFGDRFGGGDLLRFLPLVRFGDEDLDDESAPALHNDAQILAPELSPTRFTFARRQRQVVDGNLNAQNPSSPVRSLFNTNSSGPPPAWNVHRHLNIRTGRRSP